MTEASVGVQRAAGPAVPAAEHAGALSAAATEHSIAAVRVEHIGALARPTRLAGGARAHVEGRLSAGGLGALEDLAIFDSLWEQEAAGLEVFTDGEFRRHGGSVTAIGADRVANETAFLLEYAPRLFKVAVPSPSARALGTLLASEFSLAEPEGHLEARAVEVASELSAAVAAGARYVELDADRYCLFLDPFVRTTWRAWGIDPERLFAAAIDVDATCLSGVRSAGVTAAVRLCAQVLRGDRLGTRRRSLSAALLERLPYDRVLADVDPYRLHALEMLRAVPAGRSVVLGLVGTGPMSRLPSYNQLMRYIEAVTSVVRGRLAVATTAAAGCDGGRATPSRPAEQRALRLVGRVARAVWSTSAL